MKTKQNKTKTKTKTNKQTKKLQNVIGATAQLRGLPWAYFGCLVGFRALPTLE